MNQPNHSDEQLETMLRGLPLRRASDMLDRRVTRTLAGRCLPWSRLAAAACFGGVCFIFGMAVGNQDAPPPAQTPTGGGATDQRLAPAATSGASLASGSTRIDAQWPVAQAQIIYDIDGGPPVRATVRDVIEKTRWIDPENQRDVELTRPVREVSFSRDTPY